MGRYDHEGQEERAQEIASKLLTWLDQITPERVLNDIEKVLAEHEESTDHMKNPEELKGGRLDLCTHKSEYLEFTVTGFLRGGPSATTSIQLEDMA